MSHYNMCGYIDVHIHVHYTLKYGCLYHPPVPAALNSPGHFSLSGVIKLTNKLDRKPFDKADQELFEVQL